jgi:hypothetical protein
MGACLVSKGTRTSTTDRSAVMALRERTINGKIAPTLAGFLKDRNT